MVACLEANFGKNIGFHVLFHAFDGRKIPSGHFTTSITMGHWIKVEIFIKEAAKMRVNLRNLVVFLPLR